MERIKIKYCIESEPSQFPRVIKNGLFSYVKRETLVEGDVILNHLSDSECGLPMAETVEQIRTDKDLIYGIPENWKDHNIKTKEEIKNQLVSFVLKLEENE